MKTPFAISLLILGFCVTLSAQQDSDALASVYKTGNETSKSDVTAVSYTHPTYKGGQMALQNYLSKSFVYTDKDRENGFEGTIIVRCTIGASGQPEKAWIVQSVHPAVDERAKKVVLAMPSWKPAVRHGETVSTTVDIPFELKLR